MRLSLFSGEAARRCGKTKEINRIAGIAKETSRKKEKEPKVFCVLTEPAEGYHSQ
jgi:hypothetical protein